MWYKRPKPTYLKPSSISHHLHQLPPLSLTSPILSPPHSYSPKLYPLLLPHSLTLRGDLEECVVPIKGVSHYLKSFAIPKLLSLLHYTLSFSTESLKCWPRRRTSKLKGSIPGMLFCIFIEFSFLWHFIEHVVHITL